MDFTKTRFKIRAQVGKRNAVERFFRLNERTNQ